MTTKTITAFVVDSSEWNTTGTVTPMRKFTDTTSLSISHSVLTTSDRKVAVKVINTTEPPHRIRRNTQIAEISVVTKEKSNFTKPADTATLIMIAARDPDLTTYLIQLHRTGKPEQQSKTLWFPTPKNSGKPEFFTQIQT